MKNKTQLISKLFIFIAICLFCYPAIADVYNAYHSSRVINSYEANVNQMNQQDYSNLIEEVKKYNESLVNNHLRYILSDEQKEYYNSLLNITGDGVMGIVQIPKINVRLPIYHTIEDRVLQVATGHLPGSSIPIGGESTHSVISGHRGLSSAKLFTDLPKLQIGDIFQITVLKEVLTYEVDQIETVLPDELELTEIVEGQDLCTLITCVPLGINSHRLLVRGHRIETPQISEKNINTVKSFSSRNIFSTYELVMVGIAIILFIIGFVKPAIHKKAKIKKQDNKVKEQSKENVDEEHTENKKDEDNTKLNDVINVDEIEQNTNVPKNNSNKSKNKKHKKIKNKNSKAKHKKQHKKKKNQKRKR